MVSGIALVCLGSGVVVFGILAIGLVALVCAVPVYLVVKLVECLLDYWK